MGLFYSKPQEYYVLELNDVRVRGIVSTLNNLGSDIYDDFYKKLIAMPDDKPLRINIDTRGGEATMCIKICRELKRRKQITSVYISDKAYSAGTIIALCADEIHMKPNGSLSPIDPQITIPKNCYQLTSLVRAIEETQPDKLDIPEAYNLPNILKYLRIQAGNCINSKYDKELILQNMFDNPVMHSMLYFIEDLQKFDIPIMRYESREFYDEPEELEEPQISDKPEDVKQ